MLKKTVVGVALWGLASANILPRQTPAPTASAKAPEVTAISQCHLHSTQLLCMAGTTEFLVKTTPTATTNLPASFTDCHKHGPKMYCVAEDGEDVPVENATATGKPDAGHEKDATPGDAHGHEHCHFHAGVEHCVGGDEDEDGHADPGQGGSKPGRCDLRKRDYNIGLRVGLLFVILATSAIGVFAPIFLQKALPKKMSIVFTILKQFGTGVIISTAFVHLYTHASLMFANKCLGELQYEGTTSAIVMAGLFLSFVIEYIGHRIVLSKSKAAARLTASEKAQATLSTEVVSILVMEAGILFHSLLIGLTLVVAGDSFFITLFVVILFHQMFEGLALGTRIATVGANNYQYDSAALSGAESDVDKVINTSSALEQSSTTSSNTPLVLSMKKKLGLASLFAFVTPLGMAIGIGVLSKFNGNDKSTIIAIGTLDALSSGILIWVGLVEMWAADWMVGIHGQKAELADANLATVALAGFGLVSGMILMSVLGKWA